MDQSTQKEEIRNQFSKYTQIYQKMIIIVEKQHLNKYDDNKVFFKKRVKTRISNTKVIPGNNDSPPSGNK